MFDRKKYKKFAKAQLKNRWGIAILVSFLIFIVSYIFQLPSIFAFFSSEDFWYIANNASATIDDMIMALNAFSNSTPWLASIIQSLVASIFTVAALNVYIKMTRSPEPVKFNSFLEGLTNWGRAILGNLWQTLWIFLWSLIPAAVLVIFISIVTVLTVSGSAGSAAVALIITCIAALASFIPVMIKTYSYSLMFYAIAEHKNISATKALTISKIITKGHKWNLFVIDLSFIGWAILAAIPAGLGFIVLNPYMYLTKVNAYHALLQEAMENGKIKPEDLTD